MDTDKGTCPLDTLNNANRSWIPFGIMESTKGIWWLLDAGAAANQWRFYRAILS